MEALACEKISPHKPRVHVQASSSSIPRIRIRSIKVVLYWCVLARGLICKCPMKF